ncbi:hypothetical protein GCM10022389_16670 [Flavobacterium cheonanense]|uniref:Uncharacterized protein n=1 Tax=Flavobacterium cheonanense TaxID=706183 RepID=A0ABP7VQG1_9FLAO
MINFIKKLFKNDSNQNGILKKENNLESILPRRELLTKKFFRNLDLIEDFKLTYECYCDISDTWNKPAFGDSNMTNRQYYET